MITVVHTADLHLGGKYPEKAAASMEFLISELWEKPDSPAYQPDVICISGDVTDRQLHFNSPHLEPLFKFMSRVMAPLVVLQGTPSHDSFGTVDRLKYLEVGENMLLQPPTIITRPMVTDVGKVKVAALPAITKAQLYTWLGDQANDLKKVGSIEETNDLVRNCIQNILRGFAAEWHDFKGVKLLLGHLTVNGCETSTGQTLVGGDIEVSLSDLALAESSAVLLGHIHKAQCWSRPVPTCYSGSIYPCNWGELEQKSFNVYQFEEDGTLAEWESVPFPHPPMAKIELTFTGEQKTAGISAGDSPEAAYWDYLIDGESTCGPLSLEQATASIPRGAEVKVKYEVPKEIAGIITDDYILDLLHACPFEQVIPERTIRAQQRERIADIGDKKSTGDMYVAWCEASEQEPRPGAIEKANQLEEQGVSR